jgi:hypothetical protein
VLAALAQHLPGRLRRHRLVTPAPSCPSTAACCTGSGDRNPHAPAGRRSPKSSPA